MLLQPGEYTTSGASGPRTVCRSFLLATLSSDPVARQDNEVSDWQETLAQQQVGHVLVVDVPSCKVLEVQKTLGSLQTRQNMEWDRPTPSPANGPSASRLVIRGYIMSNTCTQMEATLCCLQISGAVGGIADCTVGLQAGFKDKTFLLAEFTEPEALLSFSSLYAEVLFLSGRAALIRTEASAGRWEEAMTTRMRLAPSSCVTKVKWRPSHMGGRVWAQPSATSRQIQTVRAQAGARLRGHSPGSSARDLISEVSLQGCLGPEPAMLLRNLMHNIATRAQLQLAEVDPDDDPSAGQWKMCIEASTGKPDGRILVGLQSSGRARELERSFHQAPVRVGDEMIQVHVTNHMVALLPGSSQGNVEGAPPTSRAAAPQN